MQVGLALDLTVDLTSVFSWNTKQVHTMEPQKVAVTEQAQHHENVRKEKLLGCFSPRE